MMSNGVANIRVYTLYENKNILLGMAKEPK